jgi:predicted nucleic acid-binding protein
MPQRLSEGRKPTPEPKVTAFYDAQPLNAVYISEVSIAEIRFGIELQQDSTRRVSARRLGQLVSIGRF